MLRKLVNIAEVVPETVYRLFPKLFINENGKFSLWKRTNMPLLVKNEKFFRQKKEYIENNPVRKNYVTKSEHWLYSSAFEPCLVELAGS